MLTRLIKFLKGYVLIRLSGYSPERFLNLCNHHHIVLWGLRSADTEYEMCMSISSFRKLRPLVHKTRTKVVILERHGLPFMLHRYRNRKLFVLGALGGAAVLYICSLYIWNIHVEGNLQLSDQIILDYLESEQIIHGMKKTRIHGEELEAGLREHFPEITWTSAEVKGTRLIIHIQENEDTVTDEIPDHEPADLIASESGIIVSMIVRAGTPLVSEGQQITKGDLLVQSRVEILDDAGSVANAYYVHADADIKIQRQLNYNKKFPMQYIQKCHTGENYTSYYITLGTKRVLLDFPGRDRFEYYDEMTSEFPVRITEHFYLPLVFGKQIQQEYVPKHTSYSKEEAISKAKAELNLFFKKLGIKGLQIIENNVKIDINGDVCSSAGTILIEEEAVKEQSPAIIKPDQEAIPDAEREQS